MRYMFIIHADYDQGGPTPELMEAMHEMAEREIAAGRMVFDGGLAPPAVVGKKLRVKGRKVMVIDGPFAETKEVIAGFAVFDLPDLAAAEASARAFLDLHTEHAPGWEGVMEVREIAGSQVQMIRGRAA